MMLYARLRSLRKDFLNNFLEEGREGKGREGIILRNGWREIVRKYVRKNSGFSF